MKSPQQFSRWWSESLLAIGGVRPEPVQHFERRTLTIRQRSFDAILTPQFSRSARDDQVRRALKHEKIVHQRHGLEPNCPLCRNIARSEIEPAIALAVTQAFAILPNRYPSQTGASLLLPRSHIAPSRADQAHHLALLTATAQACRNYDLIAVKNHPRDGMSLPKHDHVHLWPRDLITAKHVLGLIESRSEAEISALDASPFDSRVISGPNSLEISAKLLADFDRAGIVYTYAQVNQSVMISPRLPSIAAELISLTGPLHIFSPPYSRGLIAALTYIPLAGHFEWANFLPTETSRDLARAA